MSITKYVSDFCPYLNKEHTIQVECINTSCKEFPNRWQVIDACCEYAGKCSNPDNCPVLASNPAILRF